MKAFFISKGHTVFLQINLQFIIYQNMFNFDQEDASWVMQLFSVGGLLNDSF